MLIDDALGAPALAPHTHAALAAAHSGRPGAATGACLACLVPWATGRAPLAVLVFRGPEPATVRLGFLCGACATLPAAERRACIGTIVRGAFLDGEGEEVLVSPEAGTA